MNTLGELRYRSYLEFVHDLEYESIKFKCIYLWVQVYIGDTCTGVSHTSILLAIVYVGPNMELNINAAMFQLNWKLILLYIYTKCTSAHALIDL